MWAIVTPDNRWFDMSGLSEGAWCDVAQSLLDQYRDALAVAVDCHE